MAKLVQYKTGNDLVAVWFECPGCGSSHLVHIAPHKNWCNASWTFNGDLDKPTLNPSVNSEPNDPKHRCHFFLRDGVLQFLPDCGHSLAGKSVPIPDIDPSINPIQVA
jgi:hypothetical protein